MLPTPPHRLLFINCFDSAELKAAMFYCNLVLHTYQLPSYTRRMNSFSSTEQRKVDRFDKHTFLEDLAMSEANFPH